MSVEAITTNSLRFKNHLTDAQGNTVEISIRLNDECKNGHQDFSITGTVWEAGKQRNDRNTLRFGAIGDYIAKEFPQFATFNTLHLCDYLGAPMYAVDNGFYHLTEKSPCAQEYVRATDAEWEILSGAEDSKRFHYLLESLGIVARWKVEADAAIKDLENLTGRVFLVDSVRQHLEPLSEETRQVMQQREAEGYYTPTAIAERQTNKIAAEKAARHSALIKARDTAIDHATKSAVNEYEVKKAALDCGIMSKNFIYYNHDNSIQFNWLSYEKRISPEEIEAFKMLTVGKYQVRDGNKAKG